ncbi:MAG: NUDIX hydrolase [Phenylobacterium sp.]
MTSTVRTAVTQREITLRFYGVDPALYAIMTGEPADVPVGGTVADLYGLPEVRSFSLYGIDPHCDCDPMAFCRNPLHPGPCKGWKRTLGAVAPGALRALEAERVRKANVRREAAIARHVAAGRKVPARLKKPITLDPKGPGAPDSKPSDKIVGIPTANELRQKVDTRRAAAAKAVAVPSGSKKPRDGDGDGKLNEKYIPKGTQPGGAAAPAPANAPAPNLPTSGQPSLAAQKRALDAVNRVGKGRPTAKGQVDAYSTLSKDDFDALPQAAQDTILDDLKKAEAKFLDPKKKAEVQGLLARFGTAKPAQPATPPAAPTPGAPSAESVLAAEKMSRYNDLALGKPLNAAGLAAGADAWEKETPEGRKKFAEAYAGGVATHMAAKTKTYRQVDIGPAGTKALQDEIAADILGTGNGSPIADAMKASWSDPAKLPDLHRALYGAGVQKPPHGLERQLDAIKAATPGSGVSLADAIDDAAYDARTPEQREALDEVLRGIANDPAQPAWIRGKAESKTQAWKADPKARDWQTEESVRAATQRRVDIGGAANVFGIDDKKLAKLPANIRAAIEAKRAETLQHLVRRPGTRENMLAAVNTGHPLVIGNDTMVARIKAMSPADRDNVLDALAEQTTDDIQMGKYPEASAWESVTEAIHGSTHPPHVAKAISEAQIGGDPATQLDAYAKLTKAEADGLSDAHNIAIDDRLQKIAENGSVPALRRQAALKRAELDGNMPSYANPKTQELALHAGVLQKSATPQDQLAAAKAARKADYDELSPGGQTAVAANLQDLVDDPTSGLSLQERGTLQLKHDEFTGRDYDTNDLVAAMTSVGVGTLPDPDRFTMYEKLDVNGYDQLPAFFRKTIRDDLERLKTKDPVSYDRVMSRIDPNHQPIAPVSLPTNPAQEAALDVVYGADPKARTIPKQLSAYGGLKASDYHGFNVQEQNIILGDLAYIVGTSKDAKAKARAQALLDRFAPPGTPAGSPSVGIPMAPANAVPGQIRYPDPAGVPGLLKQSTNPGKRGDEWMNTASGNRVWGKYGAAGLMLRHVDPATGEERFLIAQRGPRISNPGMWQLPGGAIESLETPTEGATRETLEELGFKPSDLLEGRVHGIHEAKVSGVQGSPGGEWKYSSLAVTVPKMLKPDLSTAAARAETSDAKWMTRAEIDALDRQGKLLGPLSNGAIHTNITSLFPTAAQTTGTPAQPAPGTVTRRPARLAPGLRGTLPPGNPANGPSKPATPHKQSTATNLVKDHASAMALLDKIKGPVRASYRGKSADERLAAINAIQGNDRTPTVMSKAEMDRLVASGDYIEVFRGVQAGGGKTAQQIAEEFRSGPDWGGLGVFGNGYYFGENKSVADAYANSGWRGGGGAVIRALIPKSAALQDWPSVERESQKQPSSNGSYRRVGRQSMGGGTLHDEGRYAAAKGLDAIQISVSDYKRRGGNAQHVTKPVYNIVNRSILIVEGA